MLATALCCKLFFAHTPDLGLNYALCMDDLFLNQSNLTIKTWQNEEVKVHTKKQGIAFFVTDKNKTLDIRITVNVYQDPSAVPSIPKGSGQGPAIHSKSLYSNFGLGSDMDIVEGDGILADIVGKHEYLHFEMYPKDRSSSNARDLLVTNHGLFEKLVRHVYSRAVATRTAICPPVQCGQSQVSARMNQFGNQIYLNLAEWAAARGWTVATSTSGLAVTITKGNLSVDLPFGAHECTLGVQKVSFADAIIDVDGTIFVPQTLDTKFNL